MKILIIHNRYSQIGGEEKVVELQKRILLESGHEVHLYIRDYHEMDNHTFGKIRSFFSALYSVSAVRDIRKICHDFNPNVAIVHNLFPIISPAVIRILKKNSVKILMTVHNYRLFCPIGLFFRNGNLCTQCAKDKGREFRCLLNRCEGSFAGSFAYFVRGMWSRKKGYFKDVDIFLSVSKFQKTKLIENGIEKDKIFILNNCTETSDITRQEEKEDYVAFAGRLSAEKGIDMLFEIASKLPEIKFKVAGKAGTNYELPEHIPSNIEMVGFLKGEELKSFYRKSSALLFTSRVWEAMPLSPLEAMAEGTVVISTRVSSLPEILDNGKCGLLFDTTDEAVNLIKEIFQDSEKRHILETIGKERVRQFYSTERYKDSLNRILEL